MKLRISKKQIKEQIINSFLIVTLLMFFITRVISNSSLMLTVSNLCVVAIGMIGLFWIFLNKDIYIIGYTFLLIVFCIICDLIKTEWSYGSDCVFSVMFIGIAYCLYSIKVNSKLFGMLFYFVCMYFVITILVMHVSFRNIIIEGTSYNYISVIAIFYYTIYELAKIKNNGEPGIIDTIILLIVCVLGYGRGGILTAFITALLVGIYKLYVNKARKRMYLLLLIAFGVLYFILPYIQQMLTMLNAFGKFERRGLEDTRDDMWREYIVLCSKNFSDFFFGVSPIKFNYSGNMHNFLFQMHATFGMPFFIITIYLIIKSILKCVKEKQTWLLIIISCFLIRCFTDKVMFRGFGEIILYYFLFKTIKINSFTINSQ